MNTAQELRQTDFWISYHWLKVEAARDNGKDTTELLTKHKEAVLLREHLIYNYDR